MMSTALTSTCAYVFRRGANAGHACGKTCTGEFCAAHSKRVMQLNELPALVHAAIVERIISTELPAVAYRRLICLNRSCTYWRDLLATQPCGTKACAWDALYDRLQYPARVYHDHDMTGLSVTQRLELLCAKGCQRCGRSFSSKIQWPIPVRVCTVCFDAITVPEDHLINAGIPPARYHFLRSAPSRHWRMYMARDVEAVIGGRIADFRQRTLDSLRLEVQHALCESDAALTSCSRRYARVCTADEVTELTAAVGLELRLHRSRAAACCLLRCTLDDIGLSGTLQQLVDAGDRDGITANVAVIAREMARTRLQRIAGRHTDIAIPDVPRDDAAATAYVTGAVRRREAVLDASRTLDRACVLNRVFPELELGIAVDDAVPLDTFLLAVDVRRKAKVAEARFLHAKEDALTNVRSLTARLGALGVHVSVDVGPIQRAATRVDVQKASDACHRIMRGRLRVDESTFDAPMAAARRVDPAFTMQTLVPDVHARIGAVADYSVTGALHFIEEAKHAIQNAASRIELQRYQERVVRETGRKHERLLKFEAYASPTASQLQDIESVVRDLMPWACRRRS